MYALLRLEKYVPTASPDLGNNSGLGKVPRVPTAAVESGHDRIYPILALGLIRHLPGVLSGPGQDRICTIT